MKLSFCLWQLLGKKDDNMHTSCNKQNMSYSSPSRIKQWVWWLLAPLLATLFTLLPIYSSIPAFYKLLRSFPLGREIAFASQGMNVGPASLNFALYWLVASLSTFFLLWMWLRFCERKPFWYALLREKHVLRKYLQGVLCALIVLGIALALLWASGTAQLRIAMQTSLRPDDLLALLLTFFGWMVQGPKEEIIYRGWLLSTLRTRHNYWLSVAVSSVTFALAHVGNPHFNLIAGFNLTLFGIFCALYIRMDRSIWGVAGFHTAWNWMQGHLFGLPVSGIQYHGADVWLFQNASATWLNGGAFGPEGGVAVTFALLLGITSLCLWQQWLTSPNLVTKRATQPLSPSSL